MDSIDETIRVLIEDFHFVSKEEALRIMISMVTSHTLGVEWLGERGYLIYVSRNITLYIMMRKALLLAIWLSSIKTLKLRSNVVPTEDIHLYTPFSFTMLSHFIVRSVIERYRIESKCDMSLVYSE